jgi:hypothetical protein
VNIQTYCRAYTNTRYTVTAADQDFQGSFELKDISIPSIRKWELETTVDLFASLDLSAADSVSFFCMGYSTKPLFSPIPNQLTELQLSLVILRLDSLPSGQRHFLPSLTSLSLSEVIFIGPVRKFFHCPKLEKLRYVASTEGVEGPTTLEGFKRLYMAPIEEILDEIFFRDTPSLSSIFLHATALSDDLKASLGSCPVLRSLEILDCPLEKFIQPFLENLQDTKYFPSLQRLCIDDSWPTEFDMSYDEFAVRCRSARPGICVFSSGKRGWKYLKQSSDSSQSESDLGSDDEGESDEFSDGDSDPGDDFYLF